MSVIAFDSNVLIYVLEDDPNYGAKAQQAFLEIEENGGVCSTLVVTESLRGTIQTYEQLFPLSSPSIKLCPVNLAIAIRAGQLREKYGIKTPDAIHIATALESRATKFITNDKALWKLSFDNLVIEGF